MKTKKQVKNTKPVRVEILGRSATSVLKWMGSKNFTTEEARRAVARLASDEVKPSTIATALSDGKNPKYQHGIATLSRDEQKKVKAAAARK